MLIEICSLEKALMLAAEAGPPTAVISITSKEEKDVPFPDETCVTGILRLKFNDLWEEYDEEGIPYGRPLPRQAHDPFHKYGAAPAGIPACDHVESLRSAACDKTRGIFPRFAIQPRQREPR